MGLNLRFTDYERVKFLSSLITNFHDVCSSFVLSLNHVKRILKKKNLRLLSKW